MFIQRNIVFFSYEISLYENMQVPCINYHIVRLSINIFVEM